MRHRFSKVSYVSVSVRIWWPSMERRELSYFTSAGLIIQALWWPGYMLLTLPNALRSNMSATAFGIGLILLVGIPCTAIPLWMAWAVWTRRKYNFLLGLWTAWALYFGGWISLSYFIAIHNGWVLSPYGAAMSLVAALMLVLPACISVVYIFTTPSVPKDQWW